MSWKNLNPKKKPTEEDEVDEVDEEEEGDGEEDGEEEEEYGEEQEQEPMRSGPPEEDELIEQAKEYQRKNKDNIILKENVGPLGDATKRIAVMNLDWDNIRAIDLLVLFHSFAPTTGVVNSVSIYPSKYGQQQMKLDASRGPDIFAGRKNNKRNSNKNKQQQKEEEEEEEEEEDQDEVQAKVKKYELQRLKYYFAVIECDSVATADTIYKSCDNLEYQRTGNFIDLRFIPDDVEMETPLHEIATVSDLPKKYKPLDFTSKALQMSSFQSTWDQNDTRRLGVLSGNKKLVGKNTRKNKARERRNHRMEVEEEDFKAFVASEGSSEDEDKEDMRAKYLKLLGGAEGDEKEDDDEDMNMEVTFVPGLGEKLDSFKDKKIKEQLSENVKENETVWEGIQRKVKEKKKNKKQEAKALRKQREEELQSDNKDRFSRAEAAVKKRQEKETDQNELAKFELLVMPEGAGAGGKKDGKKRKRAVVELEGDEEDRRAEEKMKGFTLNTGDKRFADLGRGDFDVDPTRLMGTDQSGLLEIVQKNKQRQKEQEEENKKKPQMEDGGAGSLSDLVNNIKNKAPARKKQRK